MRATIGGAWLVAQSERILRPLLQLALQNGHNQRYVPQTKLDCVL